MKPSRPCSSWKAIALSQPPFFTATITVTLTATSVAMTMMTHPSMAAYIPPADASAPDEGSTSTNIVRGGGCTGTSTASLTALAPQHHIGQTASTQPTLVWFTPETDPYKMEFRILEKLGHQQFSSIYSTEFDATDQTNALGIGRFDLSTTDITLTPGKSYRWQVVVVCNPLFPSESLMADADLEVTERPISSLPATLSLDERVNAYAAQGVWYEAMAAAITSDSEAARWVQNNLLADLLTVEQETNPESLNPTPYIDQLQDVINILLPVSD